MGKTTSAALISVGVAAFVGGVCALIYGLAHREPTLVPIFVMLTAENYCFIGGVLTAIGAGLATFGFLMRPAGTPPIESEPLPPGSFKAPR